MLAADGSSSGPEQTGHTMSAKGYKVTEKDNGYFVTIERTECGHTTRVVTEDIQWRITAAKRAAAIERHVATRRCGTCAKG